MISKAGPRKKGGSLSTPMGVNMRKVTISGHPGSGTSTLVEGLSRHFSWTSINGGQIFRNEDYERKMTLNLVNFVQMMKLLTKTLMKNYAHIF